MFDNVKAGKQIALFRKNKGFTQEDVARRLNISPQAVSKWENGHTMPELSLLVELSELLECKIDQIFFPVSVGKANFELYCSHMRLLQILQAEAGPVACQNRQCCQPSNFLWALRSAGIP